MRQVVSTILSEIGPCPLVSYASNLGCQKTADNIKGRADEEFMITVIQGAPTCSALRGVTVVKTVEILTTRKMSSEELCDQYGLVAGVDRGP